MLIILDLEGTPEIIIKNKKHWEVIPVNLHTKIFFITVPFNNSQTIFKHYANMADVSWIQQMRTTHLTH